MTITTDTTDRLAEARDWLDQCDPLPTADELARPILDGLTAMYDIADRASEYLPLVGMGHDEDAQHRSGAVELLAVHARFVDLVSHWAAGCIAGPDDARRRAVRTAMREVLETVLDVDDLRTEVMTHDLFAPR
jgi:hypothetical protein